MGVSNKQWASMRAKYVSEASGCVEEGVGDGWMG